ncbi:hypothetical protein IV203_010963 [Nitzschia inconspicua]|uniref:Uncharacterized protein n=1 Tax=Nitzschia inconspicua TaxID=303405 RepID=A0A9K3KYP8_9STRA|nr:hypothetical protein IV203_010963 [Nitzschia inconspicua]
MTHYNMKNAAAKNTMNVNRFLPDSSSLLNVPSSSSNMSSRFQLVYPILLGPASSPDNKIQNTIDMIDAALQVVEWDWDMPVPVNNRRSVSQSSGPEQ